MAEIKWIKITTSIFDDEAIKVIEQMPEGDAILVIWFKLLVQAGIINDSGLVYFKKDIPYTEDMLAIVFHKPVTLIRLALTTFEKFGMIEIADNKTILVRNWEKHQNIETLDIIREQTRKRVKKYREKQKMLICNEKCNVTSPLHVTPCNAEEEDKEEDIYNTTILEDLKTQKIFGEYNNVCLTATQYNQLLGMCASQNLLDELVDSLSRNIEEGKEKPYKADFPNAHFIRLQKYREYRLKYPHKFTNDKRISYKDINEMNKEDIARKNMRLAENWLKKENEEE